MMVHARIIVLFVLIQLLLHHVELLAQDLDDRILLLEDQLEGLDLDELRLVLLEDVVSDRLSLVEACQAVDELVDVVNACWAEANSLSTVVVVVARHDEDVGEVEDL